MNVKGSGQIPLTRFCYLRTEFTDFGHARLAELSDHWRCDSYPNRWIITDGRNRVVLSLLDEHDIACFSYDRIFAVNRPFNLALKHYPPAIFISVEHWIRRRRS